MKKGAGHMEKEFISPFSYVQHEWKLDWEIVPSNKKYDRPNENRSEREQTALEAISAVGCIGGLQLKYLFGINKPRLKRMREKHLVVRHTLSREGREIPIYTIGKYGANKIMPEYEDNYWLKMDTLQVLKCLSFFQFCSVLDDPKIIPAPEPFTAGVYLKGIDDHPFYVYVARDGIKDLLLYLKWKENFIERIFVIAENLDYLRGLEVFMESDRPLKLRVILDEDLKKREFRLYHYDQNNQGKWIKT